LTNKRRRIFWADPFVAQVYLGPNGLQNNDGATTTIALPAGSSALDAATTSVVSQGVLNNKAIPKPQPAYPPIAK
jgi:hypothetical protein